MHREEPVRSGAPRRSLRGLLALSALLVLFGLRAHAQMTHVHQWASVNDIPTPYPSTETASALTGQVVAIYTGMEYPMEMDQCLNTGMSYGDECTFSGNWAMNQVVVTSWSDGGAGGQFGYLDATAQFQESSDPALITHYRCSLGEGDVTLAVTVDDVPEATDGQGTLTSTFDDAPVTGTCTLSVTAPQQHVHAWQTNSDIPDPGLWVYDSAPDAGAVIPLYAYLQNDHDQCVNMYDCPFYYGQVENVVRPTGWSDQGAGGQFGYLDSNGEFTESADPALVTHYRCPQVPDATRVVELTMTVDDVPSATEPGAGNLVSTFDDDPVTASAWIEVYGPHIHSWDPVNDLPSPWVQPSSSYCYPGDVISVSGGLGSGYDMDHCSNSRCTFQDGYAMNQTVVTGWNDGGAGGRFGYTDGSGQFVATNDAALITSYRCGTIAGTVTLTCTVDDVPVATDPAGNQVATWDDQPASASTTITVYAPYGYGHYHSWQPVDNLPQPELQIGGTAQPGAVLPLSVQVGNDTDQCTADGCPFSGGVAGNGVRVTGWNDGGAGGAFGFLDGDGQFQVAGDPATVTHYRCPLSAATVSLSVTVDDTPQAMEPTGTLVSTYDDAPATGSATLTVYDGSTHTHQWSVGRPLFPPGVSVESDNPVPGQVIALSVQLDQDADQCLAEGCPFPGGWAPNQVHVTSWSDGGAGGEFGFLDSTGQFVSTTDPAQVTHYRCSTGGGSASLAVTIDDLPLAVEPGSGIPVTTFDDGPVSTTHMINVAVADQHAHDWQQQDNLPPPQILLDNEEPQPGDVVAISIAAEYDHDLCLDGDNLPCEFPQQNADNAVTISAWGDGGAGGQFGFLDGNGQFVPSSDPLYITHYRVPDAPPPAAPQASGTVRAHTDPYSGVTLTVTVRDIPVATEALSGRVVSTYQDAPASASVTIRPTSGNGHTHTYNANNEKISGGYLGVSQETPATGAVIQLYTASAMDMDTCTNYSSPCPWYHFTSNRVTVTGWDDGSASPHGQFGYLDSAGQFQITSDWTRVSHYRCPTRAQSVTLHMSLDDIYQWTDANGVRQTSFDDPTVHTYHTITVGTSHVHQWFQGDNMSVPTLALEKSTATAGEVLSVTAGLATDPEYCQVSGCPLINGMTYDPVYVSSWSDNGAGGSFGYMTSAGFVATNNPSQITHYQCPAVSASTMVRITVTQDDIPQSIANATSPTTYNDHPASSNSYVTVQPGHVHNWSQANDIPGPSVTAGETELVSGQSMVLGSTLSNDTDYCLTTSPPCPFPLNQAPNQVVRTRWEAIPAIGDFGYITNGQFVATSDPNLVRVYRAGTVTQNTPVEIRLWVDDVPQATVNGKTYVTYDDAAVYGSVRITLLPTGHRHQWETTSNIPPPVLTTGADTIASGQTVPLNAQVSDDQDHCLSYSPPCSFPNNTATNTVVKKKWDDGGAGGSFGYLSSSFLSYGSFVTSTDPQRITHYRAPGGLQSPLSVTISLTVDDQLYAIDPATNAGIGTTDDDPVTVSHTITVNPGHVHHWTSTGNIADCPVSLYALGTNNLVSGATPCQILEIRKGNLTQDTDHCDRSGCSFPGGTATEDATAGQLQQYDDDANGDFGYLDARGHFIRCDKSDFSHITHYRVGNGTGTRHVWLVIDDSALATDPASGKQVGTYDDDPHAGTPYTLQVNACDTCQCGPITQREVHPVCGAPGEPAQEAMSEVSPHTGELSFDVPVTSWSALGVPMGLSLEYSSRSLADPRLDTPNTDPYLNPQPDFAHLSTHNSKWTHSWAQFLEVVTDGTGEAHAVWHAGGGSVEFDMPQLSSTDWSDWAPHDSYHSLSSYGQASTAIQLPKGYAGANQMVIVPYGKFVLHDGEGTEYDFDKVFWEKTQWAAIPYFLLTRVTDRFGRITTLKWEPYYASGVTDPVAMQLKQVLDPAGGVLQFTYSGLLLSTVQDPLQATHRFSYATYVSEWNRPENKLAGIQVQGPGSNTYTWSFDYGTPCNDLLTHKREPSGKDVHYEYEPVTIGSPPRPSPFDWDGRLARCYYDDANESGRRKIITRQPDRLIYPQGDSYTYLYQGDTFAGMRDDSTGRTVNYRFDAFNNLTKVWTDLETENNPLVQITYDTAADHRTIIKKTVTGPLTATFGDRSETTYGPFNLPLRHETGWRTVGGSGYNRVLEVLYDALGRPTSATDSAPGTGLSDTTTFASYFYEQPQSVTDSVGRTSSVEYDPVSGFPVTSYSPSNLLATPGTADAGPSVTRSQLRLNGLPTSVTDAMSRTYQLSYAPESYGSANLVVTATRPDGQCRRVTLDADGNAIKTVDEEGVVTTASYNGDGCLLAVVEAAGKPEQRSVRYTYDLDGRMLTMTNARGFVTRWEYQGYDQSGHTSGVSYEAGPTHVTYPDGTQEYYGYNQAGELAWVMHPYPVQGYTDFRTITYDRDALHRVTAVHYPDSIQQVPGFTATAQYDEFGRVTQTGDATGTSSYTYDGLDRIQSVSPSGGRLGATYTYLPDLGLHRWKTQIRLAGVPSYWEYREDGKGRLSGVQSPFGQVFSFQYFLDGSLYRQDNGNSTWSEHLYDSLGRLGTVKHHLATGAVFDQFTYQYYPSGRLKSETDLGSQVHQFGYDALGRLTSETHPDLGTGGTQYSYDPNDNRTKVVRNGQAEYYGVDVADKLLWINSAGNTAPTAGQSQPYTLYGYDADGQMNWRDRQTAGSRQTLTFQWDMAGRLRSAMRNTTYPVFGATYTGDGQRVQSSHGSVSSTDSFGLHEAVNGKPPILRVPGLAEGTDAGIGTTYHGDWLGSTRYVTGVDGTRPPYAGQRYDAYGRTTPASASLAGSTSQFAGSSGYRSEASGDNDLGLVYCYQRYYDPAAGRWMSRDPIGYEGGFNLYGYCDSDPVGRLDPTGLSGVPVPPGYNSSWTTVTVRGETQFMTPPTANHGMIQTWRWHPSPVEELHPFGDHWDVNQKLPPSPGLKQGSTRMFQVDPSGKQWIEKGKSKENAAARKNARADKRDKLAKKEKDRCRQKEAKQKESLSEMVGSSLGKLKSWLFGDPRNPVSRPGWRGSLQEDGSYSGGPGVLIGPTPLFPYGGGLPGPAPVPVGPRLVPVFGL